MKVFYRFCLAVLLFGETSYAEELKDLVGQNLRFLDNMAPYQTGWGLRIGEAIDCDLLSPANSGAPDFKETYVITAAGTTKVRALHTAGSYLSDSQLYINYYGNVSEIVYPDTLAESTVARLKRFHKACANATPRQALSGQCTADANATIAPDFSVLTLVIENKSKARWTLHCGESYLAGDYYSYRKLEEFPKTLVSFEKAATK